MANVAFQATANNTGVGVTTVTIAAFNPGAGNNRVLVVGLSWGITTQPTNVAVTYGGVALTQVPGTRGGSGSEWCELWYLVNPSSTPGDIVATWTTAADVVMGAVAANNSLQSAPVRNGKVINSDTGAKPTITVASSSKNLSIDVIASQLADSAPNQTSRWNVVSGNVSGACSTATTPANQVTHQWTTTTGFDNSHSACDIVSEDFVEPDGGGSYDDRYRFRNSHFWSMTSTLGTKRSTWPDDARDLYRRDAIADDRTRVL